MKDVVAHVHLKDAYIGRDGAARCVPLGSGTVAWIAHFRALEADGYEGLYTIETHFTPEGGTRMNGARMTLDAVRILWDQAARGVNS
jgi:L-ribulose-5-phosphate 3-epimerase